MGLTGTVILLRVCPVWNLVKVDTVPKCSLGIETFYKTAWWTDLSEDGFGGVSLYTGHWAGM